MTHQEEVIYILSFQTKKNFNIYCVEINFITIYFKIMKIFLKKLFYLFCMMRRTSEMLRCANTAILSFTDKLERDICLSFYDDKLMEYSLVPF